MTFRVIRERLSMSGDAASLTLVSDEGHEHDLVITFAMPPAGAGARDLSAEARQVAKRLLNEAAASL